MNLKDIPQLGRNSIVFYRGPKSRKPYKVRFIRIVSSLLASSTKDFDYMKNDPNEIIDYIIEIEFSSMKKETTKASNVYGTWDEAEKTMPVRDKKVQGPRIVDVLSGKTILMENGREENGVGIRLGCLEASITTKEAHVLWTLLGKSLGYCVNISNNNE